MKSFSTIIASLFTFVVVSGATDEPGPLPDIDVDYVSVEATDAEAELSFRDIPDLEKAFVDTAPADRKDGIPVGELGIDGGNKDMIVKLAQEIADKKHGEYDSLLIAYKDKLIFESYYSRGRVNLPHYQGSATKPYVSLAVGRAMQLGYLTMADLNKPLVGFLKDLDPTKFVEGVGKITLHQAMTMHSGLRFSDEQIREFGTNTSKFKGLDQIQAFLELSAPVSSESQSYRYQSPDAIMVMQVLDAVVPGSAKDFIKNELLDKLGINVYSWRNDLSGLPKADEGSSLTSRDMIKMGTLAINNGQWDGEQLISAKYLASATSGITRVGEDWQPDTFFYGYLWYQTNITVGDKSYDAKIAWGGGGQHIIALQELELIIVITGHDWDDTIMTQVSKAIVPAFVQSGLQGPYLGQNTPSLTPEVFAPGIVSTKGWEYGVVFKPGMEEMYFLRQNAETKKQEFVLFQYENNQWRESVVSPRVGQPFISPDAKIMHLGKRYKERTKTGWSEIKSLGSPFEEIPIMRLTTSSKGTYVFDEATRDGNGVLRYAGVVDGKRQDPKPLSKEINTGKWNAHPFIAPDESYILWDGERDDGYGDADIYVSFRQQDGSWGEAINLGDKINTDAWEAAASVTPDGKYLFFNRNVGSDKYENVDIFWVDAQVIETLRPE